MKQRKRKEYKISFTNKGFVICHWYDQREGGVYWKRDTVEGYSTNDLVKKIEEVEDESTV